MLIAIEGLPGSGKTTSTRLLAERLGASAVTETTADHPFLKSVYEDEDRHDFQVELAFLLLHFGGYRAINRGSLAVSDFSPVKDLLFAWDMLRGHDLALFEQVYERLYDAHPPPDVVLFLDLPPADCLDRVRARGRDFEASMSRERLDRMHSHYEQHLDKLGLEVLRIPLGPGPTPEEVVDMLLGALNDCRSVPTA